MGANWSIGDTTFHSRLLLGTGKFASVAEMQAAVRSSGSQMVTAALKRFDPDHPEDDLFTPLQALGVTVIPNTSGARNAKEAIVAAELARTLTGSPWIKLEIHPNPRHLMPYAMATVEAARELVAQDFKVLPYMHADPILAKQLEEIGCAAVMPLGAPIGSNQGLQTEVFLQQIIAEATVPVIVDAGLGRPSDAARAMELGADAVLVNTAIATAADPVRMAKAFARAVEAGLAGRQAGLAQTAGPSPSSPQTLFSELWS